MQLARYVASLSVQKFVSKQRDPIAGFKLGSASNLGILGRQSSFKLPDNNVG